MFFKILWKLHIWAHTLNPLYPQVWKAPFTSSKSICPLNFVYSTSLTDPLRPRSHIFTRPRSSPNIKRSTSRNLHSPCEVWYPPPLTNSNLALTCSKKCYDSLQTSDSKPIVPVLHSEVQNSETQTDSGQSPVPTPRELFTPARSGPGTLHPLSRPGRGAAASLRTPTGGGKAPPGSAGAARDSCSGLGPAAAAPPSRRGRQRSGGPRRARSPSTSASACQSSRARRRAQPAPRARQRGQHGPAASAARWAQPRHSEWPHGRAAASPGVSRHPAQSDSSGRGGDGGCSNGGGNTSSAGPAAGPGVPALAAAISSQRPRRPRRLRAAAAAAEEARVLGPAAAILFPVCRESPLRGRRVEGGAVGGGQRCIHIHEGRGPGLVLPGSGWREVKPY